MNQQLHLAAARVGNRENVEENTGRRVSIALLGDIASSCVGRCTTATSCRAPLDRQWSGQRLCTLEYCRTAHLADPASGLAVIHDSVCSPTGDLPFPAPVLGDAKHAEQSDSDRPVADTDIFPDAARRRAHLCDLDCALAQGVGGRAASSGTGLATDARFYVEVRPPEGPLTFC